MRYRAEATIVRRVTAITQDIVDLGTRSASLIPIAVGHSAAHVISSDLIQDYVRHSNRYPQPFQWVARASRIIPTVNGQ